MSDQQIEDYFCSMLLKMYPSIKEEDILFKGVARAKNVMTVLALNYSELLPGIKTSLPGVYVVNSSQIKDGILNVNETIKVAESKIDEILIDLFKDEK
jgi:hypothetical protein